MHVYADNAATTAMSQLAIQAMLPYFNKVYGNPSSLHSVGQEAKEVLEKARQTVALPGTSEHHLGWAFDLTDRRYPQKYTGENNAVQWLSDNCWEYGFILRYPEGKSDITGIIYEPWHYRYVGEKAAKEIFDRKIWH